MNVRDWPMGAIMQLPDCCFGRRWGVAVGGVSLGPGIHTYLSVDPLPDVCVVWEVFLSSMNVSPNGDRVEFRLGDHIPLTDAAVDEFEMLFPSLEVSASLRSSILVPYGTGFSVRSLKLPVAAQGRRLCVRFTFVTGGAANVQAGIVVSSIPTEVPDCLVSEYPRSR